MKRGIYLIVFTLLILPYVSAEIFFDQVNSLYNVGEIISVNVSLSSRVETAGFFSASLICGVNQIEVYRSIEVLGAGEKKTIRIVAVLEEIIISILNGECYLRANYGSGEARSQTFKISRSIESEVFSDGVNYNPKDTISITGTAIKDNRERLNGFVSITIVGESINLPIMKVSNVEDSSKINVSEDVLEEESSEEENSEDELENVESVGPKESKEENVIEGSVSKDEGRIIIGSLTGEVIDGAYNLLFQIPKNAPTGTYLILARVYDEDRHGNIMNEGESTSTMSVNQIISNIGMELSSGSTKPEDEFSYKVVIYDQAGALAEGEVQISILDPEGDIYTERLVKANELTTHHIESDRIPGLWSIEAKMDDLITKENFFIEEYTKIDYELDNDFLVLTNLGNINYEGFIEIQIGEETKVIEVSLEKGETNRYKLEAPDGEYVITIREGDGTKTLGKTFLTGNAVTVDEINRIAFGDIGLWIWALLAIILILIILILIRKILKKGYLRRPPKTLNSVKAHTNLSGSTMAGNSSNNGSASMTSVMQGGVKQKATVISLKLKNMANLKTSPISSNNPLEIINNSLIKAKQAGSKIYVDGDYRIIIFSLATTNEKDNDFRALRTAKDIEESFLRYNNLSSIKINFGIGVHSGEMAIEKQGNKIKFVSLGNTISIAKRVSEQSNFETLISDPLHKNTFGKIKVQKNFETGFYKVSKIPDNAEHSEFINKFLGRNK